MMRFILILIFLIQAIAVLAVNDRPNLRRACSNLSPGSQDVIVYWEKPNDACNSFTKYIIYGQPDLSSPFQNLGTINILNNTSFVHVGAKSVSSAWKYVLEIDFLCDNTTPTFSDTLSIDANNPPQTLIDSVSVDHSSNKIIIGWLPNSSPDLKAYELSRGQRRDPFDTLSGTFYTVITSNPDLAPDTFSIAPFDSCGNKPGKSPSHITMFLKNSIDTCKNIITLTWSPYIGWSSIERYEVFVSKTGGPITLAGTTSGSQTSYSHTLYTPGDSLCFFIRAIRSGVFASSSSNKICVGTRQNPLPKFVYISQVTVSDENKTSINWKVDLNGNYKRGALFRGTDGTNYDILQNFSQGITELHFDDDNNISPATTIYHYKVKLFDYCDNIILESQDAANIVVNVTNQYKENHLTWNPYTSWQAGVQNYQVFRGQNTLSGMSWDEIGQTSESNFVDKNLPAEVGESGVCYFIKAQENSGDIYGTKGISDSWKKCVFQDLIIYFPTAFRPLGANKIFKPDGLFIDFDISTMRIYNRWGTLVRTYNNLNSGWDGTDESGQFCPSGVYLYICEITGKNGKTIKKPGMVTLL